MTADIVRQPKPSDDAEPNERPVIEGIALTKHFKVRAKRFGSRGTVHAAEDVSIALHAGRVPERPRESDGAAEPLVAADADRVGDRPDGRGVARPGQ